MAGIGALVGATLASVALVAAPAGAVDAGNEAALRAAFGNASETVVNLTADITLTDCGDGEVDRNSATALVVEGNGFTVTQNCTEGVFAQVGTGTVTINNLTIAGGISGVKSNGAVFLNRSTITSQSSSGELAGVVSNGGGVTLVDSVITGLNSSGDDVFGIILDGPGGVSLTNSEISNLTSADDGVIGIANSGTGTTSMLNSRIDNLTSSVDEVFAIFTSGAAQLAGSVISGVSGEDAIGVLAGGVASLVGSTISGVAGDDTAIGVYATSASLVDSTVIGLSSDEASIGVYAPVETASALRSTIADIAGTGGAAGSFSPGVTLLNSTVTMVEGPGVYSLTASIAYSDVIGTGGPLIFANGSSAEAGDRLPAIQPLAVIPAVGQVVAEKELVVFGSVIAKARLGVANCEAGSVDTRGYNFADDTSCALTGTGDRQAAGLDPWLGTLGDNGGLTPTLLPQAGSPLLDAIPASACQTAPAAGVTADQRGLPRPAFGACDIGSVEVQPAPPPVIQPTFTG